MIHGYDVRVDHDSEILMFDVLGPLFSRGLDAYMATWKCFSRGLRSSSPLYPWCCPWSKACSRNRRLPAAVQAKPRKGSIAVRGNRGNTPFGSANGSSIDHVFHVLGKEAFDKRSILAHDCFDKTTAPPWPRESPQYSARSGAE